MDFKSGVTGKDFEADLARGVASGYGEKIRFYIRFFKVEQHVH